MPFRCLKSKQGSLQRFDTAINRIKSACFFSIWRRTVLCPFLSLNILSIFEHNLFYLTKNHSQAQVFQIITDELINFQTFMITFFIQALVPSSTMLQTGEAQKSNENILDAFIHSQIKCFFSQPNEMRFIFTAKLNQEYTLQIKLNCAFINLGKYVSDQIYFSLSKFLHKP